ncbi:Protein M01B2.12 [Aphelenchoides avenae]|nr:Protein M01B2.12 [Aphelenchus avenae]
MMNFATEERYSLQDMYLLYGKALKYAQTGVWKNSAWLRRDMDVERKNDVERKQKINATLKNNNGHKPSPINEALCGVFLQVSWSFYEGHVKSPYGTERILLPLEPILYPRLHNLYFADFYCQDVWNRHIHYVILVVCRVGSEEDFFCCENLVQLAWRANPFFRVADHTYEVSTGDQQNSHYLVHLFYAHDIDLKNTATRWSNNMMIGQGQRPLEINSDCLHCSMASTVTAAGA